MFEQFAYCQSSIRNVADSSNLTTETGQVSQPFMVVFKIFESFPKKPYFSKCTMSDMCIDIDMFSKFQHGRFFYS